MFDVSPRRRLNVFRCINFAIFWILTKSTLNWCLGNCLGLSVCNDAHAEILQHTKADLAMDAPTGVYYGISDAIDVRQPEGLCYSG